MRRVRLLVGIILAVTMLVGATVPAGAQQWIQSNSIPSYRMWCDWWWNPQSTPNGQAQWEYWCYAVDEGFWARA